MNRSACSALSAIAAAFAAAPVWFGGVASAQISAFAAYQDTALPPGAIEGAMIGAAINGIPGAIWADRNNDGYVDGYVRNGQYFPGTPQGYDRALRRVVTGPAAGVGIGAAAGAVVNSVDGVQSGGHVMDSYVAPPVVLTPHPPLPTPEPVVMSGPPPQPQPVRDGGTCEGLPRFTLTPPRPSAQMETLNNALFLRPGATLQSVSELLDEELERRDYTSGFFCVDGGFAMATKLERIQKDKTPYPGDARWVTDPQGLLDLREGFSLRKVFDALVHADPGRYRMLIFFVTNKEVKPTNQPPSVAILTLPDNAPDEVPAYYDKLPYTAAHRVRVLVYEFARPAVGEAPRLVRPTVSTLLHLERAGLRLRP